ncbi:MAG: hypothetical protein ACRDRM_10445 [Pseudonocardiaceae bacterium]
MGETVPPPVIGRADRYWDDVARRAWREHWTIRPPVISRRLPSTGC